MKSLIIIFFLSSCMSLVSFSQINLSIAISDLRNSEGKVLLELNDENEEVLHGYSEAIINKKCMIQIKNLKPGKYAFKYFHDENNDEKINTNFIGIPKEGYGFSNNAAGKFGPPAFDKMIFEVLKSDTLKCAPSYILKQK